MFVVGSRKMVHYDDTAADEAVRVYDRGMEFAIPRASASTSSPTAAATWSSRVSTRRSRSASSWPTSPTHPHRRHAALDAELGLEIVLAIEAAEESLRSGAGRSLIEHAPQRVAEAAGGRGDAGPPAPGRGERVRPRDGGGSAGADAPEPTWSLLGFLDDDPARHGTSVNGLPVLGPIERVHRPPCQAAGRPLYGPPDHYVSRRQARRAPRRSRDDRYATIVHPTADVGPSCLSARARPARPCGPDRRRASAAMWRSCRTSCSPTMSGRRLRDDRLRRPLRRRLPIRTGAYVGSGGACARGSRSASGR